MSQRSEEDDMSPLERLPPELFQHVVAYLGSNIELVQSMCTSVPTARRASYVWTLSPELSSCFSCPSFWDSCGIDATREQRNLWPSHCLGVGIFHQGCSRTHSSIPQTAEAARAAYTQWEMGESVDEHPSARGFSDLYTASDADSLESSEELMEAEENCDGDPCTLFRADGAYGVRMNLTGARHMLGRWERLPRQVRDTSVCGDPSRRLGASCEESILRRDGPMSRDSRALHAHPPYRSPASRLYLRSNLFAVARASKTLYRLLWDTSFSGAAPHSSRAGRGPQSSMLGNELRTFSSLSTVVARFLKDRFGDVPGVLDDEGGMHVGAENTKNRINGLRLLEVACEEESAGRCLESRDSPRERRLSSREDKFTALLKQLPVKE